MDLTLDQIGAWGAIVGPANVAADPKACADASVDGRIPRWVVRPGSPEEAAACVRTANDLGLSVTPRGSGTTLGLGNPPSRLDVVIDTRRMQKVIAYRREDFLVRVEAGSTLGRIDKHLAPDGLFLPLDPYAGPTRSLGGVLATGDQGPWRERYGTPRDLTAGVRFITADGTLTWGGANVVKSVAGYDVPKLLVGSLGTLGLIVEAAVRVYPRPPARACTFAAFHDRADLEAARADLVDVALEPDRLTFLSAGMARQMGIDARTPGLLVEFASVPAAVEASAGQWERIVTSHHGRFLGVPVDCWRALGESLKEPIRIKVAAPPAAMVAAWDWIATEAQQVGMSSEAVGEAGAGTLRMGLRGPTTPGTLQRFVRAARAHVRALGGFLVVERAPPAVKEAVDVWDELSAGQLQLMRALKARLDPKATLSPGRFVGGI